MITRNRDLKRLNTLGLEAKALWYAAPHSVDALKEVLKDPAYEGLPVLITGSGSNLLFSGDFNGLLIHPDFNEIKITGEDSDYVYVRAGAGVDWDVFVAWCVDRGWGGLENLSLIPGCVGACPVQNIGAYGSEVGDSIHKVEYVDIKSLKEVTLSAPECRFGYRDSIFKRELKSATVITYVTFRLSKYPVINAGYADVAAELSGVENPGLSDVRRAIIDIRRRKLPDPAVIGNAGSFFKNPVVPEALALSIQRDNPSLKLFAAGSGFSKVPAAWLIEQCGFKGKRFGNVGVHPNQALVLVAYDGATGKELLELSDRIRRAVNEKFGIEIEPEVNII
jgi:UDP-N-acetylmuramate dehydrogenase